MNTIFKRVKGTQAFTTITNGTLRDERLSFKATGILAYLLSLPDDWSVSQNHMGTVKVDGRESVMAGFKELQAAGYLKKQLNRSASGNVESVTWLVCDMRKPDWELEYASKRGTSRRENPVRGGGKNLPTPQSEKTTGGSRKKPLPPSGKKPSYKEREDKEIRQRHPSPGKPGNVVSFSEAEKTKKPSTRLNQWEICATTPSAPLPPPGDQVLEDFSRHPWCVWLCHCAGIKVVTHAEARSALGMITSRRFNAEHLLYVALTWTNAKTSWEKGLPALMAKTMALWAPKGDGMLAPGPELLLKELHEKMFPDHSTLEAQKKMRQELIDDYMNMFTERLEHPYALWEKFERWSLGLMGIDYDA